MRTTIRAVARTLGLAAALLAPGLAHAQAPFEKALPGSAFALVKVENMTKLREGFAGSQMGQLLADPAMQPMIARIRELTSEQGEKLKQALGVTLQELLQLPQGQVAAALVARDDEKTPVALLVTADAGDNAATMDEVMTRLNANAEQAGAKVGTEEFRGVTLHIIRQGDEAPPLVWGKQESRFYVATDVEALKDLLTNSAGREGALAEDDNFTAAVAKVGADSQMLAFVDLNKARDLAIKASPESGQQLNAQLELLGLNNLKAVSFGTGYDIGEFDSLSRVFVYAPGQSQGLLKLLQMPSVNLRPQPWVPAGVASYQSLSWDLDAAWTGLTELFDQVAPGVLDQVQKGLGGPDGQGLDLQKDLFGPLGDRITIISDFKKPVTEKNQRMLLGIALDDAKAFQNSLNKLFDLAKASPDKRTFQGTTVYDFPIPGEFAESSGFNGPISLAIAQDHLFVASEPSILEQVLRPGGPGLAENPDFLKVEPLYPAASSTLTYQKPEEQARLAYDMVKNGQFAQALQQATAGSENAPDFAKLIDPKLLPEFEVVEKYLAPGGGFGVMTPEGALFTQFTTRKARP